MEKENEEVEAAEQAEKKKSSKKTSGSRATDSSGGGAGTSTKVDLLCINSCCRCVLYSNMTGNVPLSVNWLQALPCIKSASSDGCRTLPLSQTAAHI